MSRAFTFLELIVVLVVLGISTAIAFPKLNRLLLTEPEPLRSGRKLVRALRHTQELAVATESASLLRIDTQAGRYWVTDRQGEKEARTVGVSSDIEGQFPDGVRILDVEPHEVDPEKGVLVVAFDPEGYCDPTVMSLTSAEGRTVKIVVGEWFGEIELVDEDSSQ
ncbi:MAG: prepilin-type N-terminal cleavage/methylation domain-containing protein [Phycisphaerales bacterium]